jgi:glutamate-1-semialdehyde 2,1-aminomutase
MAAGLATLSEIEKPGFFDTLAKTTHELTNALAAVAQSLQIPFFTASLGGMFGFCFTEKTHIADYADIAASDEVLFKKFYHSMLEKGIYFAPSMYEAGFVSSAHGELEINKTQEAAEQVLRQLKK